MEGQYGNLGDCWRVKVGKMVKGQLWCSWIGETKGHWRVGEGGFGGEDGVHVGCERWQVDSRDVAYVKTAFYLPQYVGEI